MAYADLRAWLTEAESRGELLRVNGAGVELEMSSITDLLIKEGARPIPAVLFDDIPGFSKGFRSLFALTASPWKIAHALRLPEDELDPMSLARNWRRKQENLRPISPVTVASGPVQENVDTGDRVDLLKFPVPLCHELDGGRYIGTVCSVIQKDPDEGWVNLGTYRAMLVDANHVAFHAVEGQHGRTITEKYLARGQDMPIAIAIGVDPALYCVSSHRMTDWGVSEYELAGGIKGEPIEVIEGLTGLPIPAQAEIVIEGVCHPGEIVDEGPFGEFHGYYANLGMTPVREPVIEVKAVHYRNDPILTCSSPSVPPHDTSLMASLHHSVALWKKLDASGIPGVKGVWSHECAAGWYFDVVSIEQGHSGHSREAGRLASLANARLGRYTVVVEEDIDPSNLEQVIWAIVTRGRPREAIQILDHCLANSTDPTVPVAEKKQMLPDPVHSSRAVIDACRDFDSKPDWYPVARVSTELRSRILRKFPGIIRR